MAEIEGHSYAGYRVDYTNGALQPISLVFGGTASGVGTPYTDVDSNTLDTDPMHAGTVTLTGVNSGALTGTVSRGAMGTAPIRAVALTTNGVTMIFMVMAEGGPQDSSVSINGSNLVFVSR